MEPCESCFFETIVSLSDQSRVDYVQSESPLLYLGVMAGLWLLVDSFLYVVMTGLSKRLYEASLVRAVYKFNLNKKLQETQILHYP